MWVVRVMDRGRVLVHHALETREEAQEVARIYALLGYDRVKILIEQERELADAA